MSCSLRNCYNTSLFDIFEFLKNLLPLDLIKFLLDLRRCTNLSARGHALSNYNNFAIFAAQRQFKLIEQLDKSGSRYDYSNARLSTKDLMDILEEFSRLYCNGYGKELSDLDSKYNKDSNGMMFPDGLSDKEKDEIANYFLDNNNYLETNNHLNEKYRRDLILTMGSGDVDNDSSNLKDLLDSLGDDSDKYNNGNNDDLDKYGNSNGNNILEEIDKYLDGYNGGNIKDGNGNDINHEDLSNQLFCEANTGNCLINIPNDDLLNLDLNSRFFTCFEPEFKLENYVDIAKTTKSTTIITPERIKELKKIHNELLLPIFRYYYGNGKKGACQMQIYYGLTDLKNAPGSKYFSKHLRGKAVDFSLVGIDKDIIFNDLKSKKIDINFGVIMFTTGIHITLPFTFENYKFEGMVVESPGNTSNDIVIDFI